MSERELAAFELDIALRAAGATSIRDLSITKPPAHYALRVTVVIEGQRVGGLVSPPLDINWNLVARSLLCQAREAADDALPL